MRGLAASLSSNQGKTHSQTMLTVEALSVHFGTTAAVDDVTLDVGCGEVVCLLGPSGSGKSTLLRAIAGVERPTSGRILIDDAEVAGPAAFVEPQQRQVGMVFQDYALFPHLRADANIAFGLRRGEHAIETLIERIGLASLARKFPHELSGGERQRVALARAMAPKPRLLLMDEPFSSLDSRLRDDVRRHTLEFVRESGTTTVIVTHDPDEAMRIADRIALLDHGHLVQFDTPEALYARPASLFAARFFSNVAALPGVGRDGYLETRLGRFTAPGVSQGARALACIRPQHLKLAAASAGVEGRVVASEYRGDCHHVLVAVEGVDVPVTVCVASTERHRGDAFGAGTLVHLAADTGAVPIIAEDGDTALSDQERYAN
ncbi:MAG: ABC transporter ATP-binding protein [Gammaproteobacteria bacterium]|nr:ABC transporter ATP-binding protein [Gammaproteobacteria bacterium]MDH3505891.1 ABC transporter ATP-binding protein [Gammaproteobacteria bacterium]